jgi:hypothetical protein
MQNGLGIDLGGSNLKMSEELLHLVEGHFAGLK